LVIWDLDFGFLCISFCLTAFGHKKRIGIFTSVCRDAVCSVKRNKNYYSLKLIVMSLFNTGKNKKDKKKNAPASNKSSMFIAPKGGGKANTKTSSNAGKHVGGAQRGA